jgi:hypothetical protein
MKINELLIVVFLWIASVIGAFWFGMDYKSSSDKAKAAELKQVIEDTRKMANEGAADAISKIVVRNTTIKGQVETIVRDNPVYHDCVNDPSVLRNINAALTGKTGPVGDRSVSGTDAAQ